MIQCLSLKAFRTLLILITFAVSLFIAQALTISSSQTQTQLNTRLSRHHRRKILKALALFSGGLDSLLAIKLMLEAGVEVESIYFQQPFFFPIVLKQKASHITSLAAQLHTKLHIKILGNDYLQMLQSPKYGYGRVINPCLDCHIFFLRQASLFMKEIGAAFLVTGEVLGQRPKSQFKEAFPLIDREVGLEGLIVRPLSAKLLTQTIPEAKGWLSLAHCPSIHGRERKVQLELARKYNLIYETPAGGCLLTNEIFGRKMRDLLTHQEELTIDNAPLLATGRHFRFSEHFKGIIGRNEIENNSLFYYFYTHRKASHLFLLKTKSVLGPLALGIGTPSNEELNNLARLVGRYSDLANNEPAVIRIITNNHPHLHQNMKFMVQKELASQEKYRL